jgi:hypothetical protein
MIEIDKACGPFAESRLSGPGHPDEAIDQVKVGTLFT